MKMKLGFWILTIVIGISAYGFRMGGNNTPDLSTPQKSFASFVDILKAGNASALEKVATPTGQFSLNVLYQDDNYKEGMTVLGNDLANAKPTWEEITEDIYFVKATVGDKVHKMEFTKEVPGWMLYHWQIGGGAQEGVDVPEPGNW